MESDSGVKMAKITLRKEKSPLGIIVDLELLKIQKHWLYRERACLPRSNADEATNKSDIDILEGLIELAEGILDIA